MQPSVAPPVPFAPHDRVLRNFSSMHAKVLTSDVRNTMLSIGFHPYETRGATVAVKKSAKKTSKKVAKKKPAKKAAKKAKRK